MKPFEPRKIVEGSEDIGVVLDLLREAFAYMAGRIDPPSSIGRLDLAGVALQAQTGEIWVIGEPPVACVFLNPKADHLYLGKLAVDQSERRRGLARRLLEKAEDRARDLGLSEIRLNSRIELVENHAVFAAAGYEITAANAHPGFDRPTSFAFRKTLPTRRQ